MGSLGFHPCVVGTTGNNTYNLGTPRSLSRTIKREVCHSLEIEFTEQTTASPRLSSAVTQSPSPSLFNFLSPYFSSWHQRTSVSLVPQSKRSLSVSWVHRGALPHPAFDFPPVTPVDKTFCTLLCLWVLVLCQAVTMSHFCVIEPFGCQHNPNDPCLSFRTASEFGSLPPWSQLQDLPCDPVHMGRWPRGLPVVHCHFSSHGQALTQ